MWSQLDKDVKRQKEGGSSESQNGLPVQSPKLARGFGAREGEGS